MYIYLKRSILLVIIDHQRNYFDNAGYDSSDKSTKSLTVCLVLSSSQGKAKLQPRFMP